ncbi:MAG: DUF493 domain-containing protein [Cytophagales bacterium]|nr:DUF493 domain-containing protein [Cytophagales bacterium]
MDLHWFASFKKKLDQHYAWPALYVFKFIVPAEKKAELKKLFPQHVISTEKKSGKGNYVSLTYQMMMPSSESVISVYEKAAVVEGIVAL